MWLTHTPGESRTHRGLPTTAFLLALALLLPLLSTVHASPASGAEDFCADVPQASWTDVPDDSPFIDDIDCLAGHGITLGVADATYAPTESVTRQQMATFIVRMIETATGSELSSPSSDRFDDIGAVSPDEARTAINKLAEAGVVRGVTNSSYRPRGTVDRGQMASFIARSLEGLGVDLPEGGSAPFGDVSGVHADNIAALAELGIVQGYDNGTYRPSREVSRQQMARFVVGAAQAAAAQGNGEPPVFEPLPEPEFDWCLTVEVRGEGSVENEPAGPCFEGEVEVTSTATPASGWVFSHWEGDDSGSQNPISGPIDEDWTSVAVFVEASGGGSGDSDGSGSGGEQGGSIDAASLSTSNTGYRASGLSLSELRSSGAITTSQDGQVIERVDVSGGIRVAHRDVTIRDSRVRHSGGYGISVVAGANVGTVTIENVEVDGQGVADGIGIYVTAPVHVTRANIHGQRVGMQVSSGSTVQRSYIHRQAVASGTHNTAMSSHGATGLVIRDNRLESSTSASLSLYPRLAPIRDALVTGNLFEGTGSGIGLYAGYTSNHPYRDQNRDIRITGNRWTGSFQHGTHLAWNPNQPGNTWSDNAWLNGANING
jgi:hypothetical protein